MCTYDFNNVMEKKLFYFNNKAYVLNIELHNYRNMNNIFLINDYTHTLLHISRSIYDINSILLLHIIMQCDINLKFLSIPLLVFSLTISFFWCSKYNLKQKILNYHYNNLFHFFTAIILCIG
jgi:hypothetical protein